MFPLPDVPSKFAPSYWAQVGGWIEDVAGRHLKATENTDAFPATAFDLVNLIWSEIWISTNGQRPWERRYGMTSEALDKRVWAKAEHLLATFAPAVPRGTFPGRFTRAFTAEESRRGGRNSKRPSSVLEGLRGLPADITAASAAEVLGCAERAVYTARAILKVEQRERSFKDELAELFPEIEDAPEVEDDDADMTFEVMMAEAGIGVDATTSNVDTNNIETESAESAPPGAERSITDMIPISIRTGLPVTALELAVNETRREDEARAWAECGEWMRAAGL